MQVTHPFGLALSGGGFRAAAYHLGVLKRLRELGLLAQVDVLSTVSGGSITGAYWVAWQAFKGDTISDLTQWEAFEASLIDFMQSGVRERIFQLGFVLPAIILAAVPGVCAWSFGPLDIGTSLLIISLIPIIAYVIWHYSASRLLEISYRRLFGNCKVGDLVLRPSTSVNNRLQAALDRIQKLPLLYINATALNSGEHLVFTGNLKAETFLFGWDATENYLKQTEFASRLEVDPESEAGKHISRIAAINKDFRGIDPYRPGLSRNRKSIPMPNDTPLSRAVAASSAIPFVFSPISFGNQFFHDALIRDRAPNWNPIQRVGDYQATDGGVFDNQGSHVLLGEKCSSIIVSDGAGALRAKPRTSTWQAFPPGNGAVFRALDITYERGRDLGYTRLADRHELFCMLDDLSHFLGKPDLPKAILEALSREGQIHREMSEINIFKSENRAIGHKLSDELRHVCDEKFSNEFPRLRKYAPYVAGYTYVELIPSVHFGWCKNVSRLPDQLVSLLGSVRTDLDCFSSKEISALMFHGYTTIEHSLRAYQNEWLPPSLPPLDFTFPGEGIIRNWAAPSDEEIRQATSHLTVSRSRSGLWRKIYRLAKRC